MVYTSNTEMVPTFDNKLQFFKQPKKIVLNKTKESWCYMTLESMVDMQVTLVAHSVDPKANHKKKKATDGMAQNSKDSESQKTPIKRKHGENRLTCQIKRSIA